MARHNVIAGSLRQAINFLNDASYPSAEITFDIPLSDPNCDQNTHVCTIRPVSINPPGTLNDFALPGIFSVVTIDGYTQPGSSPNTLPDGDNAVILIRLDGSLATTPGGYGLYVFEDPATIRGFNIAGWNNPDLVSQPGFAVGANAIDINAVSTFAEGNFIGTSVDGNMSITGVDPNGVGIFVENGAIIGSGVLANVVGGTTPQARNVVSGNLSVGVFTTFDAPLTQIQGNFIGTDHTGTQALGNFQDGVLAPRFDVIGGTQAGAGNVIAANGRTSYLAYSNIDINAKNGVGLGVSDLVQGNMIGTDVTGTHALGGGAGVLIAEGYQFATIGGTTPSARNVISGNSVGVDVFDYASLNSVEGNYIGVDATGSKALGTAQSFGILSTVSTTYPALENAFGGAVAGAGNVISGNQKDGVSIEGSYYTDASYPNYVGNVIQGNLIGTDATGANSVPNGANGVHLLSAMVSGVGTLAPDNNSIGGSDVSAANIISNNGGHGVFIEAGTGNNTVANVIHNNNGAGVRITGGNQNRISRNSIYGNSALGIDLDTAGPNANSACQADAAGANNLQNAPVLTAGTGTTLLSATATDPNGNTSEFSNTVNVSGHVFNALGAFNGLPNTTFTIELFSSPSADSSGFGQGDTYLGSTTVTTAANCGSAISSPINTDDADMSVSLSASNLKLGPAFGAQTYSSTVTNNGTATAHNVVWTDELPASLKIRDSSQASCANPVTTTVGSCTVSGQTVTCNLGTMASGATAAISIPVETETAGSIANTANVTATETDPNPANNTATVTVNSVEPYPVVDYLDPSAVIKGSGDLTLMVYGLNFLPTTTLTFNGTPLSTTFFDNQDCPSGLFTVYCAGLQVVVPAALLSTSGDATIQVANGATTSSDGVSGFIQDSCQYTVNPPPLSIGADGASESIYTFANAPSCTWNASSAVPWIALLDSDLAAGQSRSGNTEAHFAILPNTGASRTGNYTQAGNTFSFTQTGGTACTYTLDANSATFSSAAGSGTIGITASDPSCNYTATQYGDWISAPTPGSQIGNGSLSYSVSANTGGPRTGRITISTISGSGAIFTINQNEASACYFTLSSTSDKFPTGGGSGSFAVVASQPSCAWTAKIDPTGQSFATLTSGASGTGNGTVQFNLASNTGDGRTASITVANTTGSSQTYSANQVSANACSFALSPNSIDISSDGGTDTIPLSQSYDFCKWTANSNNPDALLLQRLSGTNGDTIPFTVAQNPGPARVLTATVGCQTYTVNQGAAASGNPVPAIVTLQPSSTPVGTAGLALTVKGTNFVSGSTVLFNGLPRTTTYISATQVTAAILAHDIDTVSTASITVTNPVPGGGVSNAVSFAITGQNPTPTVTSLQPASAAVGSAAFTLTVNGTNFTSTSVASFAGTPRTTTLVSPTQLTIPITSADLASPGTPAVVVANPAPGGGPSNSVSFNVTSPAPTLTSLSPTTVAAGSADLVLTVQGTGFISSTAVNFNGLAIATIYIDPFEVLAVVPASAVASPGSYAVTATNPTPGGGTSNALTFTVTGTGNPTPAITTLQPASASAGGAAFTLTVNGTNFLNSSTVQFNGSARTTTYISATRLTASILAGDISKTGTASVTITNPSPGGGTSNAVSFTISAANNPVPAIVTLQPASVTAGSGALTLTVNGTGFINGSVVNFGGSARTTSYASATQVTAAILASDVASVGAPAVTVTNSSPGGGTSNAVSFTINAANNPVPAIATLQPASVTAGSGALTLTVNGTGFINGSVVNFGGKSRTTTFFSSTQVTATILAGDVTSAGSYAVTVTNPVPGGGTSNTVLLSVNNPVPSITALQPQSVTAGAAAFTLTVNGTGFNSASIVSFNGSSQPTTLISGTQLSAAISAAEVANAGIVPVYVTNPGPGGGTATTVNFTINAAAAPQVSLSPATLVFPSITVGATAAAKSITLSNGGGAALNLVGITIGGAASADFSQTNNCGSSLAAGSSCTISVSFTPTSAATFAATVSVADNASGSPQTVGLSGTGTPAPVPGAALTPASLSFTAVVGTTAASQVATLKNTGNAPLTIATIALTGANSTNFTQTNTCGESLESGASCSISIIFTPAGATSYTASLSVSDNASGSPQIITLSGTGIAAPSFTISSSPATQTIQHGGTAKYSIAVLRQNSIRVQKRLVFELSINFGMGSRRGTEYLVTTDHSKGSAELVANDR